MRHVWALVLAVLLIGNPLPRAGAETVSIEPMSPDRFWAIVDATTQHAANPRKQVKSLELQLAGLSKDEIVAFDLAFFVREMQRSYTWDLWGAVYVIKGGSSNDSFDYFRFWLISRGRAVFEAALKNPEDLADLIPPDYTGDVRFEDIASVAKDMWDWKNRGGLFSWFTTPEEYPSKGFYVGHREPTGEEFEEDAEYLARRFPRLWKRFGHNTLPRN